MCKLAQAIMDRHHDRGEESEANDDSNLHGQECGRCGLGSAPGERGAFRIIFLEPLFGKLWRREYLEMVDVANLLVGIDVNPNGRHWSLLSFRFPPL